MNKQMTCSNIGQTIRSTRKAQGLTQIELAAVSGVGPRFIRDLEHGKESCHLGKTLRVLHMLGLELAVDKKRSL